MYLRWNASNRVEEAAHASFNDLSPLLTQFFGRALYTGIEVAAIEEDFNSHSLVGDLSDFVVRDPELVFDRRHKHTRESIVSGLSNQSIDRSMSNEQARANDVRLRLREIDRTTGAVSNTRM